MERSTIVRIREGLHARPATRFVRLAKSFESDIEIAKDDKSVSAKSSVKLMLLGVKELDVVTIRASGADAIEAIETLIAYLENPQSGVEDEAGTETGKAAAEPPQPLAHTLDQASADQFKGIAASEGLALGPAFPFLIREITPPMKQLAPGDIAAEVARFKAAVTKVQDHMDAALMDKSLAGSDRGIVAALRDITTDDSLAEEATAQINKGLDAVSAVLAAGSVVANQFTALDDPYLKARADDIGAVCRQICLALLGESEVNLDMMPEGAILIADDVGAFDLARAPLKHIGGIICGHGGATSHVAIIARTHGIAAVLGLGTQIDALKDAQTVALDGSIGLVHKNPDAETCRRFKTRIATATVEKQALDAYRLVIPRLKDGTLIEVAANLGSLEEIDLAKEAGAMGVGLFRTELLFMKHLHLPSEDMQFETYATLLKAFAPQPVIVRTLDVGGDKPIAGIDFPEEENPFLGWRGIRMCLARPEIFKPQLRALLRASPHGHLKVMVPMVCSVEEVQAVKDLVAVCIEELKEEGKAFAPFTLGVMIETPAAVFIAKALAREVAFFSIGTNDLTQYIMAADRLNPSVSKLNNIRHPAVMTAIEQVAKAGVEAGIMVGMCGEAAGDPTLIPEFLRMGLTELSMSPASIPRAKQCITEM